MAPPGVSYPIAPPPSAFAQSPASTPSPLSTNAPSSIIPSSPKIAPTLAESAPSHPPVHSVSTSRTNDAFPIIVLICLIILILLYIAMIVAVLWGRLRGGSCAHCQRLSQKLQRTETRLELFEMQGRQVPDRPDECRAGDLSPPPPPLPPTPPEDPYSGNSIGAGSSFPQAPRPTVVRQMESGSSTATRLSRFREHFEKDLEKEDAYEDVELSDVKAEAGTRRGTFENISLTSRGGNRYGAEPTLAARRFETHDVDGGGCGRLKGFSGYYGDEVRESQGVYGAGDELWREANERRSAERSGVVRRPGEYM